ncbi:hypothetical protein LTS10_000474 [Elasticomyces elasticus]|nr:hypothetical protein LTS10_000474 [Elasticomyces elasticus]
MSRFFRSSSSDTSSSEDEPPSDQDESNDTGQAIDGTNDGTDSITTSLRRLGPGNDGGVQSQMLLHALLEERCMNEALREHQRANGTRGHHSDAAVRATADANLSKPPKAVELPLSAHCVLARVTTLRQTFNQVETFE